MTKTAALTGATGFVGRHLIDALVAGGWRVRALTRRADPAPLQGVKWVKGDLGDAAALAELAKGSNAAIHVAGVVKSLDTRTFFTVNRDGAARFAGAVHAAGVKRLILLSSLAAREPGVSAYARSKRESEIASAEAAPALDLAVIRAPALYGPGDPQLPAAFRMMKRGLLPAPGRGDSRFSLLHVRDLTAAMLALAEAAEPVGGVYEIDDGASEGQSWPGLADTARNVFGRKVRVVSTPRPLAAFMAWSQAAAARLFSVEPMFLPDKLGELFHRDWVAHGERLRAITGWAPQVALADGLREAVDDAKLRGLL